MGAIKLLLDRTKRPQIKKGRETLSQNIKRSPLSLFCFSQNIRTQRMLHSNPEIIMACNLADHIPFSVTGRSRAMIFLIRHQNSITSIDLLQLFPESQIAKRHSFSELYLCISNTYNYRVNQVRQGNNQVVWKFYFTELAS